MVGDYALVHVGFAISLVDEAEAARTYQLLAEMGELMAQIDGESAKSQSVQEHSHEVSG